MMDSLVCKRTVCVCHLPHGYAARHGAECERRQRHIRQGTAVCALLVFNQSGKAEHSRKIKGFPQAKLLQDAHGDGIGRFGKGGIDGGKSGIYAGIVFRPHAVCAVSLGENDGDVVEYARPRDKIPVECRCIYGYRLDDGAGRTQHLRCQIENPVGFLFSRISGDGKQVPVFGIDNHRGAGRPHAGRVFGKIIFVGIKFLDGLLHFCVHRRVNGKAAVINHAGGGGASQSVFFGKVRDDVLDDGFREP